MVMHARRPDLHEDGVEPSLSHDGEGGARLDAFPSEVDASVAAPALSPTSTALSGGRSRTYRQVLLGLVLVAAVGASVLWLGSPGFAAIEGSLRVETATPGAGVTIDGTYRGTTPLLLSLPAGDHAVEVAQGSFARTLTVSVPERTTVVHHISWPSEQVSPPTAGGLEVTSEPRGQAVSVDGTPRGMTPLIVADLTPGPHEVVVGGGGSVVRRTVDIESGTTASLMVTGGAQGVTSGWLSVSVPVPLQIFEDGNLIGSSESERILVTTGTHVYEFVNTALGFRTSESVRVTTGQTASVTIDLPRGTININAVPWAEVWLDGQPLGETPLGNVSWTIGTHELTLRHPEFGERRVSATITTATPARVAVDMRNPQ